MITFSYDIDYLGQIVIGRISKIFYIFIFLNRIQVCKNYYSNEKLKNHKFSVNYLGLI